MVFDKATKKIDEINQMVNAHKDDIKKAGELLNALGGLFNGGKAQSKNPPAAAPAKDENVRQMSDDMKMLTDGSLFRAGWAIAHPKTFYIQGETP